MNETKVILSIVIPHFNSPKTLQTLLNSIPNIDEIKVIVVDDNSTKFIDEYENVVKAFSDRNITFLKNYTGKNSAGTCRNIAMEQAKGEWIMFADADDYYLDSWYDKVSKFFNSDNDIVFFAPTSIQLDTGETDIRHIEIAKKITAFADNPNKKNELTVRYLFAEPWSKLFRRKMVTDNKIKFEDIIVTNDAMFSIKCGYYAKKIECTKDEIYCITRRKGSLTTVREKNIEDIRIRNRIRRAGFLYARLTREEISLIGMDRLGMRVMYDGVKYGKGIVTYIKYLKKYKVPVLNLRCLNPFFIFSKMKKFSKDEKALKDYDKRYVVNHLDL